MKKTYILVLLTAAFAACTDSKETKLEKIAEYQKSEEMGTPDGLAKLAKMHKDYGMEYTDAEGNNYLYASAQYYYYENNWGEAKTLLAEYISRDDSTERFRNAAINLAIIHSRETDFSAADKLISEVLEKDLPSPAQWQDIIKLYEDKIEAKADIQPQDHERLSLAYTAVGRFNDATTSLDIAINDFPAYEKRANLLYRAGFVSWEYTKDTKKAKVYYDKFLAEYPEDKKADEVKSILDDGMLEMSDKAILEMLKGKAK